MFSTPTFRVFFICVSLTFSQVSLGQKFSYETYNQLVFSQPDSAFNYTQFHFNKCACETGDSGSYLNLLGGALWVQGSLISAADYFSKAISKFEASNLNQYIPGVHLNLGNVFNDLQTYRLAKLSYRIALTHKSDDADVINNLATVYLKTNQLDSAEYLLGKAKARYDSLSNQQGKVYYYANTGKLWLKKENYSKANLYLDTAQSLASEIGDQKMLAFINEVLACLFFTTKNFEAALVNAHQAKKRSTNNGFRESNRDAHQVLFEIHETLNNPDSALFYLKETTRLNDSLTKSSGRGVSEFLSDYFEERKAKEKALARVKILELNQKVEAERNQKYFYVIIGIFVFTIAFNVWWLQRLRIKRQGLSIQLSEEQNKRAQVELANEKIKSQEAAKELHYREKEILTHTLKSAEAQNFLRGIHSEIVDLPKENNRKLIELQSKLALQLNEENRWEDFKLHFEKLHETFFTELVKSHPELTSNDLKLAALTLLNLSSKEIATIQGVKHTSIDIARHRLRKKLGLEAEQSLIEYLRSYT